MSLSSQIIVLHRNPEESSPVQQPHVSIQYWLARKITQELPGWLIEPIMSVAKALTPKTPPVGQSRHTELLTAPPQLIDKFKYRDARSRDARIEESIRKCIMYS